MKIRMSILLAAAGLITSCGVQRSADDMVNTSHNIESDSNHLAKRTDDLERELVGKESPTVQHDKLDELFGDGQYFLQVSSQANDYSEPKLVELAGFAIQAMHFQYWKGDYDEPVRTLDAFFDESTELLFAHASKHIPRTMKIDVLIPNRDYIAVASLGVKLERVRPEYLQNLQRHGLKDLSLYDVMIQALQNRGRAKRTELLPNAISMVLQWKPEAIYLLQLRHNYLPLMVVGRMTALQDQSDLSRWWDTEVGVKVDLASKDPEQLKTWTNWLQMALDTRQKLHAMGIEPEYNKGMRTIFNSVDFGQAAILANKTAVKPGSVEEIVRNFALAYQKVGGGY